MARYLIPCLAISLLGTLPSNADYSIENDRTTDIKHGLYEIREEARKFVQDENKRRGAHWVAGDPNKKICVPRCIKPLTVKWVPRSYGLTLPSVAVSCSKSASKAEKWDVFVPVWKSNK